MYTHIIYLPTYLSIHSVIYTDTFKSNKEFIQFFFSIFIIQISPTVKLSASICPIVFIWPNHIPPTE